MILKREKEEITKSFLQNWKAGTGMQMYKVMMLPMAEEDGHEELNLLMVDDRIPTGAKLY